MSTLIDPVLAGDFVNLNFEDAMLPVLEPGHGEGVADADGIPGWTSYYNADRTIGHNSQSLGGPLISIWGPVPWNTNYILQGDYSLQMNTYFYAPSRGPAVGQVGRIPPDTRSLGFYALPNPGLEIRFDGHVVPFALVRENEQYSVFGADMSEYAGETGELLLVAVGSEWDYPGWVVIDNIRFLSFSLTGPWISAVRMGEGVKISWPNWASDDGYVLESAAEPGGEWTPVTVQPERGVHSSSVIVSAADDLKLFRMIKISMSATITTQAQSSGDREDF